MEKKSFRMVLILMAFLLILLGLSMYVVKQGQSRKVSTYVKTDHKMAIVIDDFGNNMKGTDEILKLNIPITVAVMPFLSTTEQDATRAHDAGKEVIIHMPMEPMKGKASWLGPGALRSSMSDKEIVKALEEAIANVPYAIGMNNHMGSKVTKDERIMRIVLETCKKHKLYYLDSKTSYKSVIPKLAQEIGVPYFENRLFLDDEYTTAHVQKQIGLALTLMESEPLSVIIGHVGVTGIITSSALEKAIPALLERGDIVPLSDLIEASIIDQKIF